MSGGSESEFWTMFRDERVDPPSNDFETRLHDRLAEVAEEQQRRVRPQRGRVVRGPWRVRRLLAAALVLGSASALAYVGLRGGDEPADIRAEGVPSAPPQLPAQPPPPERREQERPRPELPSPERVTPPIERPDPPRMEGPAEHETRRSERVEVPRLESPALDDRPDLEQPGPRALPVPRMDVEVDRAHAPSVPNRPDRPDVSGAMRPDLPERIERPELPDARDRLAPPPRRQAPPRPDLPRRPTPPPRR